MGFGGHIWRGLSGNIRRTLVTGSLMLVPVALTYLLLRLIFDLVNGVLQPGVEWVFAQWGLGWTVPGLGVGAAVLLIYLTGFLLANKVGSKMFGWTQAAALKVPLIGAIYSASHKLVGSFSGAGETGFKRVVMVEYPRLGAWSIGFLTAITTTDSSKQLAVVYIPTAPLPNSGWVAIVPVEQVMDTDMSVPTAMQMVFSGGIVSPQAIKTRRLVETHEIVEEIISQGQ
jgi:uncharacterized membrane protein